MKERDRMVSRMWNLYKKGGIPSAVASMFDARTAQQMAFIRSVMKEQRRHDTARVPLYELETVVFDLETTGFSPYNGDEIISIGAVLVQGDRLMEEQTFHSLVNPKRDIPDHIVQLTGITNEMAAAAPDLIEALRRFLEFAQKRVLIVHGSGHDKHFLNSALWKTSKVRLTHRLLDCMVIAKWLNPGLDSYSLDALLDLYGIEVTIRHHALADAVMTAKLWIKLMREVLDKQVATLNDLYAYLSRH